MAERVYGPRKAVDPTFGPALKAERLACGLTQAPAAARAGITVDYWRDLEQGQRGVPLPATLEKISEALVPPPPPGTVALSPKRLKRHRRWKPECPKCRQKDRVAKMFNHRAGRLEGYFCGWCHSFLPDFLPSRDAAAKFPMAGLSYSERK